MKSNEFENPHLDVSTPFARRFILAGYVQGVGFRPFVYRLACALGIRGWVRNTMGQVEIHAEGAPWALAEFARGLVEQAPPLAQPRIVADTPAMVSGAADFRILESRADEEADIHLPPDHAICADCLAELDDTADRRHRYAFINCTQCGPRYTIITALPYERAHTSMRGFPLCPSCRAEYEDPRDRRFHAEPVACPKCGPHLWFVEVDRARPAPLPNPGISRSREGDEAALAAAVSALRAGKIVAVKGIGGYHLMCDATNALALEHLRSRKPRPTKPLAVMFPDLESLHGEVELGPEAEAMLTSPARPIVLLPKRRQTVPQGSKGKLNDAIAPGLAEIGCLLPYSPLHHLLLREFGGPLVATSGNVGGEPVLIDENEAEKRLAHVADAFLHHDRPIVRPADDAVFRPIAGAFRPLRLGRGVAPVELALPRPLPCPVLALGGHTKNCIALAWDDRAVVSPHIGDLDSEQSLDTLARVAKDLQAIYRVGAEAVLVDRHPGYGYRPYARGLGLSLHAIGHHRAHASALAWEHPGVVHWIVFTWDGVGLGDDGALWGGEAFVGRPGAWRRVASFRPFRLPGGDKAGREPWRAAAALLWECALDYPAAPALAKAAWEKGLNSPTSSAVGRLFDAAAALTGLCQYASYEGEGPMRLEAIAAQAAPAAGIDLPLARDASDLWRSDWTPLLPMLTDAARTATERAALFHASLARALVAQASRLREEFGIMDVGLTGGVFQNRLLTELALARLTAAGFRVHLAERLPVNDAGLAFGQIVEWLHSLP